MNDKKEKTYTPAEAALLVLKKTEEMYKNSTLAKANTAHEVEVGEEPSNDEAECPAYLAEADIESGSSTGKHGEAKPSVSGVSEGSEIGSEEEELDEDGKPKKKVPEHEEGMDEETKEIHDETESESDAEEVVDDKKVESQDKDEKDADIVEDKEEKKEVKEEIKGEKKNPFEKAEKLNSFMKKKDMKKMKNAKIEKFLGVGEATEGNAPKASQKPSSLSSAPKAPQKPKAPKMNGGM